MGVVSQRRLSFYERHASVSGGELTVSVQRATASHDFLRSLTVVAIAHAEAAADLDPVRREDDGTFLAMKLQLPSIHIAEVVLTYVTEAPAWTARYRVVVGGNGKVMLEGWAIVDNTSGEDWKGVLVGVGTSSALPFKYDLMERAASPARDVADRGSVRGRAAHRRLAVQGHRGGRCER